jgi:hypothetical protein
MAILSPEVQNQYSIVFHFYNLNIGFLDFLSCVVSYKVSLNNIAKRAILESFTIIIKFMKLQGK